MHVGKLATEHNGLHVSFTWRRGRAAVGVAAW